MRWLLQVLTAPLVRLLFAVKHPRVASRPRITDGGVSTAELVRRLTHGR
jgi:hypothetical protein